MNHNEHNMSSDGGDDALLLQAFQYFTGELSSDECEAFESLLAESQAAREALSACVGMTGAVLAALAAEVSASASAPSALPERPNLRSNSRQRVARLVSLIGIGAAVLIALFGMPGVRSSSDPEEAIVSSGVDSANDADLAHLWLATREELAEHRRVTGAGMDWLYDHDSALTSPFIASDFAWSEVDEGSDSEVIDLGGGQAVGGDDVAPRTPSWMLAAVSVGEQVEGDWNHDSTIGEATDGGSPATDKP
ncbi:MAG: hypothetical protein R3C99_12365 [Pirellulaceae bacterium]